MTSPRDDGRLDVPIARVADGHGGARRAAAVAATVVLVLGGAFAAARIEERASAVASPSGPPPASAIAARPSGSPTASPRPRPSGAVRVETLPQLARVPLPGAPEVTLLERAGPTGGDLDVVVWTPDDGRSRTVRRIPGAAADPDGSVRDAIVPILAPNRRHLVLFGRSSNTTPDLDEATVLDDSGRTLWSATGVNAVSGAAWSADSRLVVVPGQPRIWHLVSLDQPGHATDHPVTLPFDVYVPYPVPNGWLTFSSIEPRTVALGFSADGAWIYGGVISPDLGMLIGQFRVAVDGSSVEPVADFGVGRPDGLVPRPGTAGSQTVDPVAGRVATSRINSDTTGGPRTLEIRGPDEAFLFAVGGGVTLGAGWGADGNLYTLSSDSLLYPEAIELRRIGPDGATEPALMTTGPLTSGALIGVRDGYAVVALLAARPRPGVELVVVDLARPERATGLRIDPSVVLVGATLDR
jgi:hypothetical protein